MENTSIQPFGPHDPLYLRDLIIINRDIVKEYPILNSRAKLHIKLNNYVYQILDRFSAFGNEIHSLSKSPVTYFELAFALWHSFPIEEKRYFLNEIFFPLHERSKGATYHGKQMIELFISSFNVKNRIDKLSFFEINCDDVHSHHLPRKDYEEAFVRFYELSCAPEKTHFTSSIFLSHKESYQRFMKNAEPPLDTISTVMGMISDILSFTDSDEELLNYVKIQASILDSPILEYLAEKTNFNKEYAIHYLLNDIASNFNVESNHKKFDFIFHKFCQLYSVKGFGPITHGMAFENFLCRNNFLEMQKNEIYIDMLDTLSIKPYIITKTNYSTYITANPLKVLTGFSSPKQARKYLNYLFQIGANRTIDIGSFFMPSFCGDTKELVEHKSKTHIFNFMDHNDIDFIFSKYLAKNGKKEKKIMKMFIAGFAKTLSSEYSYKSLDKDVLFSEYNNFYQKNKNKYSYIVNKMIEKLSVGGNIKHLPEEYCTDSSPVMDMCYIIAAFEDIDITIENQKRVLRWIMSPDINKTNLSYLWESFPRIIAYLKFDETLVLKAIARNVKTWNAASDEVVSYSDSTASSPKIYTHLLYSPHYSDKLKKNLIIIASSLHKDNLARCNKFNEKLNEKYEVFAKSVVENTSSILMGFIEKKIPHIEQQKKILSIYNLPLFIREKINEDLVAAMVVPKFSSKVYFYLDGKNGTNNIDYKDTFDFFDFFHPKYGFETEEILKYHSIFYTNYIYFMKKAILYSNQKDNLSTLRMNLYKRNDRLCRYKKDVIQKIILESNDTPDNIKIIKFIMENYVGN
jgi:hypothetical protein